CPRKLAVTDDTGALTAGAPPHRRTPKCVAEHRFGNPQPAPRAPTTPPQFVPTPSTSSPPLGLSGHPRHHPRTPGRATLVDSPEEVAAGAGGVRGGRARGTDRRPGLRGCPAGLRGCPGLRAIACRRRLTVRAEPRSVC